MSQMLNGRCHPGVPMVLVFKGVLLCCWLARGLASLVPRPVASLVGPQLDGMRTEGEEERWPWCVCASSWGWPQAAANSVACNNRNVFAHSSGGWKSEVKVLAGLCSRKGSGGESVLASFGFWQLLAFLGLGWRPSHLCHHLPTALPWSLPFQDICHRV